MSFSKNAIPQLVIQEVDIPEGDRNYIEQVINQDITVHVIEISDLENATGIHLDNLTGTQSFIQTDRDIGINNQVSQNISQTIDFPLLPSSYSSSESQPIYSEDFNGDFDKFINNDNALDTVQFIDQQALVEGNNNSLDFYSEQRIYDLSGYGEFGYDPDHVFDETTDFDNFLFDFTSSSLLDSTQLGIQDVIVFGDNNDIIQESNQSIDTFIIVDEDSSQELLEEYDDLSTVQFSFQESFLDEDNNLVEQNINQNIQLNFGLSDITSDELTGTEGTELANPQFSIDDFILPILDNNNEGSEFFENHEVLANQKNQQIANVFGNHNTDEKYNNQILIFTEYETRELVFENPDDIFEVDLADYLYGQEGFYGQEDLICNDSNNNSISDWLSSTIDSTFYV